MKDVTRKSGSPDTEVVAAERLEQAAARRADRVEQTPAVPFGHVLDELSRVTADVRTDRSYSRRRSEASCAVRVRARPRATSLLASALRKLQTAERPEERRSGRPERLPAQRDGQAAAAEARQDRRAYPRRRGRSSLLARAVELDGDQSQQSLWPTQRDWKLLATDNRGSVIDVSMNGVALRLPKRLPVGRRVLVRLSNPQLDRHVDVVARVLRVEPLAGRDEGQYKTVCVFQRRLTLDEVVWLGCQR